MKIEGNKSGPLLKLPLFISAALLFLFCLIVLGYAQDPMELRMPDEKATLGKKLPEVKLFDAAGRQFFLKEIMDNKPLLISPVYTRCTTACFTITDSLREVVAKTGGLGKEFNVLSLSFDTRDSVEDLEKFRQQWSLDGETWVVASGEEGEVKKLLTALDFRYKYDNTTGEFLHPNLIVAITPDGRVSRYLNGVLPKERDLSLTVMEAKKGLSMLSPFDGFYLRCFTFDGATGTYRTDWKFISETVLGSATILTIFLFFFGRDIYCFIFRRKKPLQ